jgi:hypothetical protein
MGVFIFPVFIFPEGSPIKKRMIKKEMERDSLKKL